MVGQHVSRKIKQWYIKRFGEILTAYCNRAIRRTDLSTSIKQTRCIANGLTNIGVDYAAYFKYNVAALGIASA
jgi:hypothetical protein